MTQTVSLGDVCKKIDYGFTASADFSIKSPKFLRITDIQGGYINWQTVPGCDIDAAAIEKNKLHKGDIVIARTGNSTGENAYIKDDIDAVFASFLIRFQPDESKIYPPFLRYVLRSTRWFDFSKSLAHAKSAQPGANAKELSSFHFMLPDMKSQILCGDMLSEIDEKIELNRKMDETLEQIGQALFRHYFIDNPAVGNLTIGDVADVIDCLHSKKPEKVDYDTGNILLQLNNIKDDGTLDLSDKYYISDEDYSKWISRIEASENDFVITNVGRSGAVAKIPEGVKAALGRNMTGIRLKPKTNFPGFMSFLLNSAYMKKQIESRLDHGTILSALNVKNIPKLLLPTSNEELIFEHEAEFVNIRSRIEANVNEIQTLTTLRDTLLPRLINGKIKF